MEVAGIEPASGGISTKATTCLAQALILRRSNSLMPDSL